MQNVKTTFQGKPISEKGLSKRIELWDRYPDRGIVAQAHSQNPNAEILVTEDGWFIDGVRQPDPEYRWRPKSIRKTKPDD